MLVLAFGDLAEVLPGFAAIVASPAFPFIHETHDIAALILSLFVAYRMTPGIGLGVIVWFLALHVPYILLDFPEELNEWVRLMLMGAAALFGIYIIHNLRQLEKRFAEQATLDPLTGLLNHRHFHKELEYQLALAQRYGERAAILFVDLDGFKAVNDRLGHEAGDVLLKRIVDLLRRNLRVADRAARLGGDEFAALLPRADLHQASMAAERFRQAIGALTADNSPPVSASIGIAVYPDHGNSAESLLSRADQAMYRAKAEGRNRSAVFAGEPTPTPEAVGEA